MSEDSAEMADRDLIRRMSEAIAAGDSDAFGQGLDRDVVWEHNPGAGSPEEGTYRGLEEVVAHFERITEPWERMWLEPTETTRLEHGTYLVKGQLHAKHATSSSELVPPAEQCLEIRGGLLVKGRMVTG